MKQSKLLFLGLALCCMACNRSTPQPYTHPSEDNAQQVQLALADYTENYLPWLRTNNLATLDEGNCNGGTLSVGTLDTLQHILNYYRALCWLPPVTIDSARLADLQHLALMYKMQGSATTTPQASWACYNAAAANRAADTRVSAQRLGTEAIDFWMRDEGHGKEACPNRRWLLYSRVQQVGWGGNANFTLLNTQGPYLTPTQPTPFVAWPPNRFIASPLVPNRWSFSLAGADFSNATVSMSGPEDAEPIVLNRNPINPNFGDATLTWDIANLRLPPPAALIRYLVVIDNVRVDGQAQRFSYFVSVFNPIR